MNLKFRHYRTLRYRKQWHLLLSILVGMFLSQGCSSQLKLDSRWSPQQINIDGDESDWQGALTYVDGKNVSIGMKNDGEFLYLCLVSTDRMLQRQMMMRGFTVWFDPDGGKEKTFGIRFPIGMMDSGMMFSGRGRDGDPESMRENFSRSLAELELIWPEEKRRTRLPAANAQGIAAAIGDPMDKLVYEIKVPLQKGEDFPNAIGISDGKRLGMGLEIEEIDREAMRERMGRGGSGGGRRGSHGGFGGGGRGRGRGGAGQRQQMPKPFKLWFSFQLGREGESISGEILDMARNTTSASDIPKSARPGRWATDDGAPNVGEIAPTFILKSLDGESETDLESFRGQKPVVLFFGSYT